MAGDSSVDRPVACAFCLSNGVLRADQVLLESTGFYLCAPRGQLVRGFLAIVPYRCRTSLSRLSPERLAELSRLVRVVEDFYARAYGCTEGSFYEQGRGGAGAEVDVLGGFPHHTHLCALPVQCGLHEWLEGQFDRVELSSLSELPTATRGEPYLYARSVDQQSVYLGRSARDRERLESYRLKPQIARLLDMAEPPRWRDHRDEAELRALISEFRQHGEPASHASARARSAPHASPHSMPSNVRISPNPACARARS